jgi:hypothetical protein
MHPGHKRDFSYLNYCTTFSVEGDESVQYDTRACFNEIVLRYREKDDSVLVSGITASNKYVVEVRFGNPVQDDNNCCLLSKDELSEWIEDMKRFADFEFNIRPCTNTYYDENEDEERDFEENEAVLVDLKFDNRPFAEHFLVLEMIKHSYEFPFNFSVYQAVKFRNVINPNELLINLHNMIFCCNVRFSNHSCQDHVITFGSWINSYDYRNFVMMRTSEEIKQYLAVTQTLSAVFDPAVLGIEYVNDRIAANIAHNLRDDKSNEATKACKEQVEKFDYIDEDNSIIRNFERYFDPKLCKKRLDKYLNTYERIKRNE